MNTLEALILYVIFSINQWFGTEFGKESISFDSEITAIESSKSGMSSKSVIDELPIYPDVLDRLEISFYEPRFPLIINPECVTEIDP